MVPTFAISESKFLRKLSVYFCIRKLWKSVSQGCKFLRACKYVSDPVSLKIIYFLGLKLLFMISIIELASFEELKLRTLF